MGFLLRMFTGNPVTMVYVALAIAAAAGSLGAAGGWKVNGWRLGEQVQAAERDRDHWRDQTKVVAAAASACSAGVADGRKAADAALLAAGELRKAAAGMNAPLISQLARIEGQIGKRPTIEQAGDCNWGWGQIEADPRQKAGTP